MTRVFALVDCNNFYASCEKLFRPDLKHSPVVVLSNNDGCVVARSQEVKALGIQMGGPVFKLADEIKHHGIVCFSSNYALYADMSARVMSLLEEAAPAVEIYSIDEAFLDLTGVDNCTDLLTFCQNLKQKVDRNTGIPVCIGIAPSKTLAKLANHGAKQYKATKGVVNLMDSVRQKRLLALVDVEKVWGVGKRIAKKLQILGIHTALDLAQADIKMIREQFSVVLERTVRELNGIACIELEQVPPTKQQIICSRSFASRITDKAKMREALCKYVTRAAEKLRQQKRKAKVVNVFIRTSAFSSDEAQYSNSILADLPYPSDDTRDLIAIVEASLETLWKAGFRYAKAGVVLLDFYDADHGQGELFRSVQTQTRSRALMQVLDDINLKGVGHVYFASQGTAPVWLMKREHLSPAYTTNWKDLPLVR
jgi:DNA polymerase V